MKETKRINMGRTVLCDFCNADWTDSRVSGGFLFQSKAVCPVCAVEWLPKIEASGEAGFIRARCPEGMSFPDWVRAIRGGDGLIVFYEMDEGERLGGG